MTKHYSSKDRTRIDVAIVGGGIAGTWLLRLLSQQGYNAILLERNELGCGQTLASQGMIHGGLKYALTGLLSNESEAIAEMPFRWRNCLHSKEGEIDLRGTKILSNNYYMYSESKIGKLASFFASKALRGRIEKVAHDDKPEVFNQFKGLLYKLNDLVLNTESLLRELLSGLEDRVFKLECSDKTVKKIDRGYQLNLSDTKIETDTLINCSGNGTQSLLETLNISEFNIQNRPLKQIIVDAPQDLNMFAHCLTNLSSTEPRMTITTHQKKDRKIWYIGGQLANEGAHLSDDVLIQKTKAELKQCVSWLKPKEESMKILAIDRVEPHTKNQRKPDEAFAERAQDFIQCFPTKLTLTPNLGDKIMLLLDRPKHKGSVNSTHTRASVGVPPW